MMKSIEIIKAKKSGGCIWLSGIEGEGEFMEFHLNKNSKEHSFWKNGKRHGETKYFYPDGSLYISSFWENGKEIEMNVHFCKMEKIIEKY